MTSLCSFLHGFARNNPFLLEIGLHAKCYVRGLVPLSHLYAGIKPCAVRRSTIQMWVLVNLRGYQSKTGLSTILCPPARPNSLSWLPWHWLHIYQTYDNDLNCSCGWNQEKLWALTECLWVFKNKRVLPTSVRGQLVYKIERNLNIIMRVCA